MEFEERMIPSSSLTDALIFPYVLTTASRWLAAVAVLLPDGTRLCLVAFGRRHSASFLLVFPDRTSTASMRKTSLPSEERCIVHL